MDNEKEQHTFLDEEIEEMKERMTKYLKDLGYIGFRMDPDDREYESPLVKESMERLESLLNAFAMDECQSVTYRLPLYCLTVFDAEPKYTDFLLRCIKTNATKKDESLELVDPMEQVLLEYERKMSSCIDKSGKIGFKKASEFLKILEEYIDYYLTHSEDMMGTLEMTYYFSSEKFIATVLWNIIINNIDADFDRDAFQEHYEIYRSFLLIKTPIEAAERILKMFYDYSNREEMLKMAFVKSTINGPEKYEPIKKAMNFIRGQLKNSIEIIKNKGREATAYEACQLSRSLNNMSEEEFYKNFSAADEFEYGRVYSQSYMKKVINHYILQMNSFESLLQVLRQDSMTHPVYNLPSIAFFESDKDFDDDYVFEAIRLMLKGIKMNATNKISYGLFGNDICEEELHYYEEIMASYIEDDYSIKISNITVFTNLFIDYLDTYFLKSGIGFIESIGYNHYPLIKMNYLVGLLIYFIFCNLGTRIRGEACVPIYSAVESILENSDITYGGALHLVYENYVLKVYEEAKAWAEENSQSIEVTLNEEKVEEDVLGKYIVDGRVVRVCDEETFRRLLEDGDLNSVRVEEYVAQMRNLKKRQEDIEFAKRMALSKEYLFTAEEAVLYDKYAGNGYVADVISNIDSILEEFMVASSEDQGFYLDEVGNYFDKLRERIATLEEKSTESSLESQRIVYFSTVLPDGTKLPFLLKSIRKDKKCNLKQMSTILNKLINGVTMGDREVPASNIPRKMFTKGKDARIFYVTIDDIIVVVDGGQGEEAQKAAIKLAQSEDFADYLKQLQGNLALGKRCDDEDYTMAIMSYLNKGSKVKVKK